MGNYLFRSWGQRKLFKPAYSKVSYKRKNTNAFTHNNFNIAFPFVHVYTLSKRINLFSQSKVKLLLNAQRTFKTGPSVWKNQTMEEEIKMVIGLIFLTFALNWLEAMWMIHRHHCITRRSWLLLAAKFHHVDQYFVCPYLKHYIIDELIQLNATNWH